MRSTQTCPKCAGKKFVVTEEFRQPGEHGSNVTRPVRSMTIAFGRTVAGEHSWNNYKTAGGFESWICLGCGYTEFYAWGLAGIKELAEKYPEQLRIVDATSKQGPYR